MADRSTLTSGDLLIALLVGLLLPLPEETDS